MADPPDDALRALARLHADVDAQAAALAAHHGRRLACARGCSACCVDGLRVFTVEAEVIRRAAGDLLAAGEAHAPGACAFLDAEGACRVYAARPYVCRTQGLPLRWTAPGDDGAPVELRDVCELNLRDDGPPLEQLDEADCWTLGPAEARLRSIERDFSRGRPRRVALRALFASGPRES
jgi:hypothetical protein